MAEGVSIRAAASDNYMVREIFEFLEPDRMGATAVSGGKAPRTLFPSIN